MKTWSLKERSGSMPYNDFISSSAVISFLEKLHCQQLRLNVTVIVL